jgi:ketosteroid isomerase-like protein
MLDIYGGAVTGNRPRIDANISDEATLWDTHAMPLVHGKAELNTVRDARPPQDDEHPAPGLITSSPEVRVWGDTAVLVHYFALQPSDGSPDIRIRNTSVWRREGRWLMVHNHEDIMHLDYWPEPASGQ